MTKGINHHFIITTAVTFSRIFLAPILIYFHSHQLYPWAWWVIYILIELSDLMDGKLARRWGVKSDMGKTMDPFSDIFSRVLIIGYFSLQGILPFFLAVIIILREVAMLILRFIRLRQHRAIAANILGKIKVVLYGISIMFTLLSQHILYALYISEKIRTEGFTGQGFGHYYLFSRIAQIVANSVLVFAATLALVSFFVYLVQDYRVSKNRLLVKEKKSV